MDEVVDDIQDELDAYKETYSKDLDAFNEYMSYTEDDDYDLEVEDVLDTENIDILEIRKKKQERENEKSKLEKDEILQYQSLLFPEKKLYRSLLKEYFPVDLCIELDKITRTHSVDNNAKKRYICELLDKYEVPYSTLASGTNRYGLMIDGYAIKIAFDEAGKIDNKREFIYSIPLQPYVIKTYETSETGLISVCEYVQSFDRNDYMKGENTVEMRKILKDIASSFMIGDMGINIDNYANWGYRDDGSICILDYAYIYSVRYQQFVCSCDPSVILYYDKDFNDLICPKCGKKYSFQQLRKRISRKDQEKEIGNILEKGYVIDEIEKELPFNHKFVSGATERIMTKLIGDKKKKEKKIERHSNKEKQRWGDDNAPIKSFEEILKSI